MECGGRASASEGVELWRVALAARRRGVTAAEREGVGRAAACDFVGRHGSSAFTQTNI